MGNILLSDLIQLCMPNIVVRILKDNEWVGTFPIKLIPTSYWSESVRLINFEGDELSLWIGELRDE